MAEAMMSPAVGVLILCVLATVNFALAGWNIERKLYALAGFNIGCAAYLLVVAVKI